MILKVCGMRDPENIRAVQQLAIDWMGFIFYPESKRYVFEDEIVADTIRQCKKEKVGVFVNADPEEILKKASLFELDILQLHGKESVSECKMLKDRHYKVIKAFSVETVNDLNSVHEYEGVVDYFLFDTKCEGYGGSGKRFDWSVLHAYRGNVPFLLSGGISLDSLLDIEQFQHPQMAGIDVNSGFELAPALKDIAKLQAFVERFE